MTKVEKLVTEHLTDARWREVFLFVSGLLDSGADDLLLLMEKEAQKYINTPKLQTLLNWAERITTGSAGDFKPVGKRAVVIAITMSIMSIMYTDLCNPYANANAYLIAEANLNANTYAIVRAYASAIATALVEAFRYANPNDNPNVIAPPMANVKTIADCIPRAINCTREFGELEIFNNVNFTMLIDELEKLETKIPDEEQPLEKRDIFFRHLGQTLLNTFNLSLDIISLSQLEVQLLLKYFYATNLIMHCKKASVRVSPQTWEAIETRMLLVPSN
ncbi:MAG: hypothetical protein KME50_00945 [Nostoc desertorum CM1-VF14]|jgi:hypothetical protein|nr:hypothetical protein [Nostoc desertorum CM1-VF14]